MPIFMVERFRWSQGARRRDKEGLMRRKVVHALLVAVTAFLLGTVVSGIAAFALQPAGSVRVDSIGAAGAIATTSTTWANVPGFSTTVDIPSGRVADIMVSFTAEAFASDFPTNLLLRAQVQGVNASPPSYVFAHANDDIAPQGDPGTKAANFRFAAAPAGTRTIALQWRSSTGNQVTLANRAMLVWANIR